MVKVGEYEFPEELYYHKDHCWVKVEGDKVRIGYNDFGAKAAGNLVYIDTPFEGDEVEQGQPIGTVESGKWVGKLISPISGTVVESNEALEDDPTLINKDPYGEGWIAVIKPSKLEEELKNLYHSPDEITQWIKREITEKLKK